MTGASHYSQELIAKDRHENGQTFAIPSRSLANPHCWHSCRRGLMQWRDLVKLFAVSAPDRNGSESYPWPGNVRELRNVIERSVIVCDTDGFTVDESWLSTAPAV